MSRGRLLGLAAVLVLLLGALVVGGRGGGGVAPAPQEASLVGLREAAALAPCPEGVGEGLPDLVLPCVGAPGEVRLSAPGTGRPLLLNMWATWCGPCVREVPLLQEVHESGRLDVVGVVFQDTAENALRFADDPGLGFDMTYPSVLDDSGTLLREYGQGPPVTLFVSADGEVAHVQRGEMTREQLTALSAEHLGVRL